jgi:cytochrome P450
MKSSTRYESKLPAHVPASLVHDFDVYNPSQGTGDHFGSLRNLFDVGVPDIFWTRHNGGHWIMARGEYIAEAAKNTAAFSSTRMAVPDEFNFTENRLLPIMADPPDHTMYRALISPAFSPVAVRDLEQGIRDLAVSLIEGLKPKGKCEFIDDFALHLPIDIFMRLVDLPKEHRRGLLELSDRIQHPSEESKDDVLKLIIDYLRPIVAERKANPGNDLLSKMAHAKVNGRALSDLEVHQICSLLLLGGLDTVASSLGVIAHFLAQSPEHRHDLADHPEIIPNALEELLRRFPVVTGPGRYLMQDIEFHGVTLRKGDHIIMPRALYNFDDRIFADPMKVDFRRPKPIHASFGTAGGPHRCPGSFLARTEITTFLQEWPRRIRDFELVPDAPVRFQGGFNVSVKALPLIWR